MVCITLISAAGSMMRKCRTIQVRVLGSRDFYRGRVVVTQRSHKPLQAGSSLAFGIAQQIQGYNQSVDGDEKCLLE